MDLEEELVNEEVVVFGKAGSLVGILHRPAAGCARPDAPVVLLLNAGILHRVGPNRLYVTIARDLARRGFQVLRFDLTGIGDSRGGNGETTFFDDTLEAMAEVGRRTGATQFMLMGICMGAKIALEVARRDSRVTSVVCMEGIYVKSPRYYVTRLLDMRKWKRLLMGRSHFTQQLLRRLSPRAGGSTPSAAPPQGGTAAPLLLDSVSPKEMKASLRSLLERGTSVLLLFRDGNEIAFNYRLQRTGDRIAAIGLDDGLTVEFIRFADHTFTPLLSQQLLVDTTMEWIERRYPAAGEQPRLAAAV